MSIKKVDNDKEMAMIVEEILNREVTNMPYDFQFRKNMEQYPKTNHEELNLPGIFKTKEDPLIFVPDDGILEMDYVESVLPDGERIFRQAALDVEQETGPVKNDKKQTIFEYWINTIIKLKKLVYPYVITNYDYKKDFIEYTIEGIPIRINLIIIHEKKIRELLNSLKNKDYTKEKFQSKDHVRFNHCLIFAKKPYACDVVAELAKLFTTIEHVSLDVQRDLFSSLCMMIKYHFEDDKTKKELVTMMLESVPQEQYENLSRDEKMQIAFARAHRIIDLKDELLNKKDETILQKDKENSRLKELLRANNIDF